MNRTLAAISTVAALLTVVGNTMFANRNTPVRILPEPAQTLLTRDMGLTEGQLVLVRNGRVMVGTLETAGEPKETAVFGAVRITVTKEQFFAQYRDIERFKRHKAVLQLGRFSPSPALDDVRGLTFSRATLDDLRDCRPGRCKVKLPAAWMSDLGRNVDWSGPGWRDDAQAVLRQKFVDYVASYLSVGAVALVEYSDKKIPVRLADSFHAIVQRSPSLTLQFPDFQRYLVAYPHVVLPGTDGFIYWSQEQFGLKPVVSISHVTVHQDARLPNVIVGASKQLYATHYFEASLGLTIAVDDGDAARPGIYLVYMNRTRADALGGSFGAMRRSVVNARTREGVEKTLTELKRRLEAAEPLPE